jgi:hypothetical protein
MHNEASPHFWIAASNFRIKNIRKDELGMAGQLHSPQDHPTSTGYICNYWAILRSNVCVCARATAFNDIAVQQQVKDPRKSIGKAW